MYTHSVGTSYRISNKLIYSKSSESALSVDKIPITEVSLRDIIKESDILTPVSKYICKKWKYSNLFMKGKNG